MPEGKIFISSSPKVCCTEVTPCNTSAIMRLKAAVWCATKTVNNPKHTVNKEQANMDRKNTQ